MKISIHAPNCPQEASSWVVPRDIRPATENIHTKGAQAWTPQKENNAERRESFILKQTHLSVNNDMHGNILT
jgi:hypothetical protein